MHSRRRCTILGALYTSALLCLPAAAGGLKVGKAAPPATLTTLDGQHLSTTELRGQVVIVTFWATWCVPCRDELPLLSTYAREHAGDGLTVLGFSLDDPGNLAQVRAVAGTLAFPTGLLGSDRLPGYGRLWRIPVSFTLDRQGLLVDNGWDDRQPVWTRERLDQIIGPLLASR
jgi:cytochrome c biogenesis protein CcmG/thiol:disulfide interchange protein DsbE